MFTLHKHRLPHFIKWVSLLCTENVYTSSKSNLYVHKFRPFCTTETSVNSKYNRLVIKEAQSVLLEYLHCTRSLEIMDAENMSRNSPEFFDKLLNRLDIDDCGVGHSLARFLRYHPINEFEPFFESIGLKHCEYVRFLPQNFMFLNDDKLLLENYHVLCNYGIARNRIGRVYMEAREVFRYERGVLGSKLNFYQSLGLRPSFFSKVIVSSPHLLIGDVNREFVEVLEKLKKSGIGYDFIEEHISENDSYDWKCMLEVIQCLLSELGFSEGQLGKIFTGHPDSLLARSGRVTFCLSGFMLKFGSTPTDVQNVILQVPEKLSLVKFINNLSKCYKFLLGINMNFQDISRIIRSHTLLLGSSEIKKVRTLLVALNCGKSRLREMVNDDPYVLKKLVRGVRVERMPDRNKLAIEARIMKTKFLLTLGFVEGSNEMVNALNVYRGKGDELQERLDCLVDFGLSREEAISFVRGYPQTLNQSKDLIETKLRYFVKDLGYSMSDLLGYPGAVSYGMERLKLRALMYKWLRDERVVHPKLSLSTLLSCTEKRFVKLYVMSHPSGPDVWKNLKKEICSD